MSAVRARSPEVRGRFQTLTVRFGVLYAFILAVVVGVCAVLWLQLILIRADSARVMEETRELELLVRVRSNLHSAQACQADPECAGTEELKLLRQFILPALEALQDLDGYEGDPSRRQHQRDEGRLLEQLGQDLGKLSAILEASTEELSAEPFTQLLGTAEHGVAVLHRETLEEAREADLDLEQRTSGMRRVMLGTVLAALLLLAAALGSVHVGVVRPLQALRDGAERYGRGELGHRIRVHNHDELADLAEALNGMAARLADAQDHLEQRVRTRTRQFIRAARLADLGVLASGVAHEVNTPLASILSCAEGLQRRLTEGQLPRELLEDYSETISREVLRARAITTRMLALVRRQPGQLSQVSLQVILDQARSALGYKAQHSQVELNVIDLPQDVQLYLDGGELVQILVNLLSNALDASPRGAQVFLRVEVLQRTIALEVEDSGPGIPEEDLERVLEPFFTTKASDEGTGLGLALVHTLVESHRGKLSIENKPTGGALFKVSLPRDWRTNA